MPEPVALVASNAAALRRGGGPSLVAVCSLLGTRAPGPHHRGKPKRVAMPGRTLAAVGG